MTRIITADTLATFCAVVVTCISFIGGYLLANFGSVELLIKILSWSAAACFLLFLGYTVRILLLVTIRRP